MRPIYKGNWPLTSRRRLKQKFTDHAKAIPILKDRTGNYCHLCEMKSPLLAIEHIFSQKDYPRLKSHWNNFLLICTSCNSRKSQSKLLSPYRKSYYWGHLNNTALAFQYPLSNNCVIQSSSLLTIEQKRKADNLIDLYKLDKITTSTGDEDTRHGERLDTLSKALRRMLEYKKNQCTVPAIVDMATSCGFFSVWLEVFKHETIILQALIDSPPFSQHGQTKLCFDANFQPIPRNPSNKVDSI